MSKNKQKLALLLILTGLFLVSVTAFGQTTQLPPDSERPGESIIEELPQPTDPPLDPCPYPEREPRFVYREKVVHEERQFRAEHTGCGGDIMMRKWQVVGIEIGRCEGTQPNPDCSNPTWRDEFIYFYDRYTPDKKGDLFEEVGSWQKAWPSSGRWLTENQMEEKYGEPIPFPTCQTDCLQAPPGVPEEVGAFKQEDPYYFNNPWLPDLIGGEIPQNIEHLREKDILGGNNPLSRAPLPVKIFWWNIPGWHEGWIENGELKFCDNDDPENIACVDSYIIRFDNINREDRPPKFHRHEVINRLIDEKFGGDEDRYEDAQDIFDTLESYNHDAYRSYREDQNDSRALDVMRYDRDNIVGCNNCGMEKEIWLETNTFNPLSFEPKYDYERDHREYMKEYMLERHDDPTVREIIKDTYNSYGRPAFFRSDTEHTFSLQAACSRHDYLEEEEGAKGPEATFSFETSDAPELIAPLDPNWVSPYDPKEYDPNFDPTRLKAEEYDYPDGYRYPAETGDTGVEAGTYELDGMDLTDPISQHLNPPDNPVEVDLDDGTTVERVATDGTSGDPKIVDGEPSESARDYQEYIRENAPTSDNLAYQIVHAGGDPNIPPEEYWPNIIPTARIVQEIHNHFGGAIDVTSAYRSLSYNRTHVPQSSDNSQHVQNTAIDFGLTGTSNRAIYNYALNLRQNGYFSGGVGLYGGFVHIDTRGSNATWDLSFHPGFESTTMEAGQPNYLKEESSLRSWVDQVSDPNSIWDEDPNSLVLQDHVSFREELEWAQQWYQETPDSRPVPPRNYLLSIGEGTRVTTETISEYGDPVLEDCHTQLTQTFFGSPICILRYRPRNTEEAQHRFPEPNHRDRDMEFFTLPEDEGVDLYSWNVASCKEREASDCTSFSQMWRFQLDAREEERLFAPTNVRPPNLKQAIVEEDDATVGFPFTIEWERRFGAMSYVYRLREADGSEWIDAKIQSGNEVYYDQDDLSGELIMPGMPPTPIDRTFDLDTNYEWDIKACWDSHTDHGFDEDDTEAILDWAEENKQCSSWRSETDASAPFEFKTTGRPPSYVNSPTGNVEYPIHFDWESVPGAKSYAVAITGYDIFSPVNFETEYFIVPESEFDYYDDLLVETNYNYSIHSCALPVEEIEEFETDDSNAFEARRASLRCGNAGSNDFVVILLPPTELRPGTIDSTNPSVISSDELTQTLDWNSVPGAEGYRVEITGPGGTEEIITEETFATHTFSSPDTSVIYEWTVQSCLTPDCEIYDDVSGADDEDVRSPPSVTHYIEVRNPYFLDFVGVVPCGRNVDIFYDNPNLDSRDDCEAIHLFVMIALIIEEILVKIIIPYSLVVLLLYTGYLYYTGLGDPKTMKKVFKIWEAALKGYLLILLSWIIVGVFLTLVGYQFGTWWEIANL